ncbi:glycosyltransferase family 4 protein [Mycobacterium crocinum]|uniref:Glycosyltransferase family 4 protein n=1 Tax=Mycolicibacterium crocinum TaxID=388459 RepID=A0ABY3TMJ0_9MYCO|nr:glycosyltransferase family 4 protein [Mycolicibacterium crocinum]MCV7218142.1 glycosyltransferase family 4 protein [Mycolicibacterium crocinum]ULN42571.1 glycosyltransferase family 4 protein [Mycolicibacterium crocinum]
MDAKTRKVAIIQHRLLHYRLGLFEQLRSACATLNIELALIHGDATPTESVRQDTGELAWATKVRNRHWRVGGRDLLWQPISGVVQQADLVVLMQESRILSNYPWLFGRGPRQTRVAYWGHGRNFQSNSPTGLLERWKRRTLTSVDWWFAYTDITAAIVRDANFPQERITVLNNAIDNRSFAADLASVSDAEIAALRASIDASENAVVGLFCGSLYADKRLHMMLESCRRVVNRHPDFRLVVLGDGPSRRDLQPAMGKPWFHWAGTQRGKEKAAWFKAANLLINPGAVGLHILDSFAAEIPLLTTKDAKHGPEISYLEDGISGIVTEGTVEAFASAIQQLIDQPERRASLGRQARTKAQSYTLDAMVESFVSGMDACLRMPRLH